MPLYRALVKGIHVAGKDIPVGGTFTAQAEAVRDQLKLKFVEKAKPATRRRKRAPRA